jgi:hypothetical protein
MKTKLVLGGLKSYFPFLPTNYKGTGGTTNTSYCHSVWLRHLTLLHRAGLDTKPHTMVEIGPGDSIGMGLAALLSGVERYLALDVVEHANDDANRRVFDELLPYFQDRAPMAGDEEHPGTHPKLDSYAFPRDILTESRLAEALAPERIARIRRSITRGPAGDGGSMIRYVCPWFDAGVVDAGSVDMVCSQGALQDMDDEHDQDVLQTALRAMASWLRVGGVMSHHIDFYVPLGEYWNEHWSYSDLKWKMIRGRRPYFRNRQPLSRYLDLFEQYGFRVVSVVRGREASPLRRDQLVPRYRHLTDDDLATRCGTIVAVKS